MTRTTIRRDDASNRATMTYQDDMGRVVTREFFAPAEGGYVRENWNNPRQVCAMLAGGGATLVWNPKRDPELVDLIRRERAQAMRAERAMMRRMGAR